MIPVIIVMYPAPSHIIMCSILALIDCIVMSVKIIHSQTSKRIPDRLFLQAPTSWSRQCLCRVLGLRVCSMHAWVMHTQHYI